MRFSAVLLGFLFSMLIMFSMVAIVADAARKKLKKKKTGSGTAKHNPSGHSNSGHGPLTRKAFKKFHRWFEVKKIARCVCVVLGAFTIYRTH